MNVAVQKKAPVKSKVQRQYGDLGTPEIKIRQHVGIEVRERTANGVARTMGCRVYNQTPMDRYFQRKLLDKNIDRNYLLFQAGERLMSDFYYSGLQSKTTSSYEPRIKKAFVFMEHREDKLRNYKKAMKAISLDLRAILVHVCCLQGFANEWAIKRGNRAETGIVVLRLALNELAIFYGLIKKNVDT